MGRMSWGKIVAGHRYVNNGHVVAPQLKMRRDCDLDLDLDRAMDLDQDL